MGSSLSLCRFLMSSILNESHLLVDKVLALNKISVNLEMLADVFFPGVHAEVTHEKLSLADVIGVHVRSYSGSDGLFFGTCCLLFFDT